MAENTRELRKGRRFVRLTSPGRVLFPDDGITKGNLWDYYRAAAPVLLPHLKNRPFTLKRFYAGIDQEAFFQKDLSRSKPAWLPTRPFRTYRREGGSRIAHFALVNDEFALLWMVQMHCIDMNAWYSRVDKPARPDFVLFDLDPPDGGFRQAVKVAHLLREVLEAVGLRSFVKTSGADGIHVLVPIARRSTFEATRDFALDVSRLLEARHPGVVTTEWLKKKRRGVFMDANQNAWGKTIASAYSVRPKPGAPVSTPLRWEELTPRLNPRRFTMRRVLDRVERDGDLFARVLALRQPLAAAHKRLPPE
jgi:bifunctional non-homologous end joining protein LigD